MEELNFIDIDELVKEEQRRYKAEWRRNNVDRVRESNKRYWVKRALTRRNAEKAEGGTTDGN